MRVTICQLPNTTEAMVRGLSSLLDHVALHSSELLVLPEMAFAPWPCAAQRFDPEVWTAAVEAHERWMTELVAMAPTRVIVSRPVVEDGRRLNRAFAIEQGLARGVHDKFYLPDEPGYWEASWYARGDGRFETFDIAGCKAGVLLCTELWFPHRGRAYGKSGADLIAVPRATPSTSVDAWVTGGRSLAMISGCYVLSSNLGPPHSDVADLGGVGFACDPAGRVMATTSEGCPFVTIDIDLDQARASKLGYPRYVRDEIDDDSDACESD